MGSLTQEQKSTIIGCLLGDGSMRCKANALLEINHSLEQKSYVDWKYKTLKNLTKTPPKARKGNGSRIAYRFTTLSLPRLTPIFREFYKGKKKVIPSNLILTPLTLAIWFMDDGCKSYRALYLNTQQFDVKYQKLLMYMLEAQHGIKATLNKDKQYYRIRIAVVSVRRFREITEKYILPELRYKFPANDPVTTEAKAEMVVTP